MSKIDELDENFDPEYDSEYDDEEEFEEDEIYSTMSLMEDLENKIEDLIEEKLEILSNVFKLRIEYAGSIDFMSYLHICSFMQEVFDEISNEQIVLNKLQDYLNSKVDDLTPTEFEFGTKYTEYLNLLTYFDQVEDTRTDEYVGYVMKIGQLLNTRSISPYYLEPHRRYIQLDEDKTKSIYQKVPSIKK